MNEARGGDPDLDPIERLADSFIARYRTGERPSVEEYAARHPELADVIRALLPTLIDLEHDLGPEDSATFVPGPTAGTGPPKHLGDYLLLREVGRGGMGVVYEAVQQSLGRHVALKVLPAGALGDPTRLERFRLEARAAARLHHGNIVPVYGVGEQEGVHYYAMQYIRGQTLDAVIDELRRLRGRPSRNASPEATPSTFAGVPLARTVAEGLLTGCFSKLGNPDERFDAPAKVEAGPAASDPAGVTRQTTSSDRSELSSAAGEAAYLRSVARVGLQVAEALDYAHTQGVLHRDVKPSNLMLDAAGAVWVTDFGLAKAEEDSGLTRTGDVVGTLRYMAPERFEGRSDPRSDLYSLGATLYELLTLRPMFDEPDRARLIQRVLNDSPAPPRKLDRRVPRDLETVVLKATARDPAGRYRSAAELAEDLRRFLADRPVLARRATATERLARWARRNPAVAALSMTVALLLVALTAWSAYYASEQVRIANEKSDAARKTAASLHRSLLGQASAARTARKPGYRREVWTHLREALALDVPDRDPAAIRREVLACLADPIGLDPVPVELAHVARVRRARPDTAIVNFLRETVNETTLSDRDAVTPDGRTAALPLLATPDGKNIWSVVVMKSDGRIVRDDGVGTDDEPRALPLGEPHCLRLTADGTKLAAGCEQGVIVWTVGDGLLPWAIFRGDPVHKVAIDPSGRLLAAMNINHGVELWDLESNRLVASLTPPQGTDDVEFSADGRLLLTLSGGQARRAWPVRDTPERVAFHGHHGGVPGVEFSPDGRRLASVSKDGSVRLWDARTGTQVWSAEDPDELQTVAFSPDGRLLAACGWKGQVRLRDAETGSVRAEVTASGQVWHLRFDPGGQYLAAVGRRLWLWRFRDGAAPALEPSIVTGVPDENSQSFAMHPSGTECAFFDGSGGIHRFDLLRGTSEPLPGVRAFRGVQGLDYDRSGRLLFARGPGALGRVGPEANAPVETIRTAGNDSSVRVSPDGRWVASQSIAGRITIYDADRGTELLTLPPEAGVPWYWSWSPDGTRLAVARADGGVAVWDLEQVRARLAEFGVGIPSTVADAAKRPVPDEDRRAVRAALDRIAHAARAFELKEQAEWAGSEGRWAEAAAGLADWLEDHPDDHFVGFRAAAAFAAAGDADGARRLAARMLDRFGNTTESIPAERTAMACLFLPGGPLDEAARLAALAVETASGGQRPYAETARAFADYRAGRYDEAASRADEIIGYAPAAAVNRAAFLRAMALARAGRRDEADGALAEALWLSRGFLDPVGGDFGGYWHDPAIAHALRREALSLIPAEASRPDNHRRDAAQAARTRVTTAALRARADIALRERRWAAAAADLTLLRDRRPDDVRVHGMLCHAFQALGDEAALRAVAEQMIRRFAETDSAAVATLTVLATGKADLNEPDRERRFTLAELVPEDSDNGRAARAAALMGLGRWQDALTWIDRLIHSIEQRGDDASAYVHLWKALALHHLGDRRAAHESAVAAGRIDAWEAEERGWPQASLLAAVLRELDRLDPGYRAAFERAPVEARRPDGSE